MADGTHGDPFIMTATPGPHTLNLTWHNEEIFGAGFGNYPVAFAKITPSFDRGSVKIAHNTGWGVLQVQTFYERVDGYPDWEGQGYESWNIGTGADDLDDQVWNGLVTWFAFIDYNPDSSLPALGPISVPYTVGQDIDATTLTNGTVTNLAPVSAATLLTSPPTMSNLGSVIMDAGSNKALVIYGSMDALYADLIDVATAAPTVLDHETIVTESFMNWYVYPLGPEVIVGRAVFSPSFSTTWWSVTTDGTAVTVTPISAPAAFSAGGNSTNSDWFPLNLTGLGLQVTSTANIRQVGTGGSITSTGPAWTDPASWTLNGAKPVPGDATKVWMTVTDTASFDLLGVVRASISGNTITSDSPVFSDLPTYATTPLAASNFGEIIAISADYAVYLYWAEDPVNGVADPELGAWIDVLRYNAGTITRVSRNKIEDVVKHFDVNNTFQDIYFVTDFPSYEAPGFTAGGITYLHGWREDYTITGSFGTIDSTSTPERFAFTVGPTGVVSANIVTQPNSMSATSSVQRAATVGTKVLMVFHQTAFATGTQGGMRAVAYTPTTTEPDPDPDPDPEPEPEPEPEPTTMDPATPGCAAGDVQIIPGNTLYETVYFNVTDTDGTRWLLEDVEGWWTLAPPSILDIPRPQKADGSYDVEGNYLSRLVTITGRFIPPGSGQVADKRHRLLRACDTVRGGPAQLVFYEDPPKMSYARLIDQPEVSTDKVSGETVFQLPFKCMDPRKYALVESTATAGSYTTSGSGRTYDRTYDRDYTDVVAPPSENQVVAVNAGSVPTPPTIVLTGPMSDPEIVNDTTGQNLSFPGLIIQDGEYVVIDVQEHSALLGATAQRVSYLAYDSVWWWLQPGTNEIRLLANDGSGGPATGTMTFTWRSAWME